MLCTQANKEQTTMYKLLDKWDY